MSDLAQALVKRGQNTKGEQVGLRKTKVAFGTVVGSKVKAEGIHVKWSGALLQSLLLRFRSYIGLTSDQKSDKLS
jgi:hypothetical protein